MKRALAVLCLMCALLWLSGCERAADPLVCSLDDTVISQLNGLENQIRQELETLLPADEAEKWTQRLPQEDAGKEAWRETIRKGIEGFLRVLTEGEAERLQEAGENPE